MQLIRTLKAYSVKETALACRWVDCSVDDGTHLGRFHSVKWRCYEDTVGYFWEFNYDFRGLARTTVSQDVQTRFPVQLAFAKFLSKIKGNFWGSAVSMILALY